MDTVKKSMKTIGFAFRRLLFAASAAMLLGTVRADSPAIPTPMITASEDGRYAFILTPGPEDWRGDKSSGIAYEVTHSGELREIWRTQGWYSFQTFLAADGRHLVRMGPWNEGDKPSESDIAVAFYRDGKLLKSYSTAALVRDRSRVITSVSHYRWLAEYPATPRLGWSGDFFLTAIDGMEYRFDVTSGEIKSAEAEESRSQGWATARDIDRILLAIQFADRRFPFPELGAQLGLPHRTRELSIGFGQGHQSQILGLNSSGSPYVGYALEIEVQKPASQTTTFSGTIAGDVTATRLLYYTPDERRLLVTASNDVKAVVAELKAVASASSKSPVQLAEEALTRFNGGRLPR